MKIRKFDAPDMRQAMRLVRDELGPDAVILSSRRNGDRVEVSVATDEQLQSMQAGDANRRGSSPPERATVKVAEAASSSPGSQDVGIELRTLRRMLETQMAQLAWNDLSRRAPLTVEILRDLAKIGFADDITSQLIEHIPEHLDLDRARRLAIARLADELTVSGDRWLSHGGVLALVGPTGVGKTTTIAKLAARWVRQHGAQSVALISADSVRFGGHEQLLRIGRLLAVPAYVIDDYATLPALLARLRERQLVLIDTSGMSQRDGRWPELLATLAGADERLELVLTLAAGAQAGAADETLARGGRIRPTSCILTKLDEATNLGGILSSLIRTRLPLTYIADGQRIPEDLRPARALELMALADSLGTRRSDAYETGAVHAVS